MNDLIETRYYPMILNPFPINYKQSTLVLIESLVPRSSSKSRSGFSLSSSCVLFDYAPSSEPTIFKSLLPAPEISGFSPSCVLAEHYELSSTPFDE